MVEKIYRQWYPLMIETVNRPDLPSILAVLVHRIFARNSEWAFRANLNQFFSGMLSFVFAALARAYHAVVQTVEASNGQYQSSS
jgi:hypothetical protein